MKILILNAVVLNSGDAAILEGLARLLREAFGEPLQLVVHDAHPTVSRNYYPEGEFREPPFQTVTGGRRWLGGGTLGRFIARIFRGPNLARFHFGLKFWQRKWMRAAGVLLRREERELLAEFQSADLVVSTGGTYLVEHYPLAPKFFELELALNLDRPLVLFTQSLGPFANSVNRQRMQRVGKDARCTMVRDSVSAQHLVDLGVPTSKITVSADGAFALPTAGRSVGRRNYSSPRIAISVRAWSWYRTSTAKNGHKQFVKAIAEVTRRVIESRNATVVFLSSCQGVPQYHFDDSAVACEVVATLPDDVRASVTVDSTFHRPQDLVAALESFDVVVATRMHVAILALLAGTPAVSIAYEFKSRELFATMGFDHLVEDIETIEAESLWRRLEAALNRNEALRREVSDAVGRQRELALRGISVLRSAIR